jgi:hypothetical protein
MRLPWRRWRRPPRLRQAGAQTCTRDSLKANVATYFTAVETHQMSVIATAPNLRITQNGLEIKPGDGFFKTGGKVQFQRHLLDTERCGTVTQIINRKGELFFNPQGVLDTKVEAPFATPCHR